MEGAHSSHSDDAGDSTATNQNLAATNNQNELTHTDADTEHDDESDIEYLHAENVKRFKLAEEVCNTAQEVANGSDAQPFLEHVEDILPGVLTKGKESIVKESSPPDGQLDSDDDPDDPSAPPETELVPNAADSEMPQQLSTDERREGALFDDSSWCPSSADGMSDSTHYSVHLDSDSSDSNDEKPAVLLKKPPKHNWFIVPEIQNRQFGTSAKKQSSVLFQRRCYGSLHCVQRLELMYKLEHHTGCVNAINFHPNGKWLVSGSDDLEIVVWDWKLGNSMFAFDSKHKGNVFQTKFLPLSGDMHIVSCARDGQVRLAQVSQEGLKSTRKLGAHRGPSHKLIVLQDQPQVVISVGEDGLILRHDLRSPKSAKVATSHKSIPIPLYSISGNPLNTNEYCVAGRDYRVKSYDQRMNAEPLKSYRPFDKLTDAEKSLHITCAVYNHNGSEIVASYTDEDIYLFDVNGATGSYLHKYQGHRNGATIKGVNFFGPKSEYVISGSDCGYVYFWEKESEAIVQWLHADDNGVVNCLEPHPQLPFLCTSGLDPDVKVWVPSFEEEPKFAQLADTVTSNLKARSHWSSLSPNEWRNFALESSSNESDSDSSLSSFTWSSNTSENISDDNGDDDDDHDHDDNDSDGPGACAPS